MTATASVLDAQIKCATALRRLGGRARRDQLAAPCWVISDLAPILSGQIIADGLTDLESAVNRWAWALGTTVKADEFGGRPRIKAEKTHPTGADVVVWAYLSATPNDTNEGA
jgi:hypothetical protein